MPNSQQLFPQEFKDFCPDDQFVEETQCLDICGWDPSYSKTQVNFILCLFKCICTNHCIYLNVVIFALMSFRNTDQSHFAAQSAAFLPNTTQATRITSAQYTEKSLTAKFCSTVRTAHSLQARELWRRMLKYSTYRVQHGRIMGAHRELCCTRRPKRILIELDRETVWRRRCTIAKNAHSGTHSTML